jgi:hypothetical protein
MRRLAAPLLAAAATSVAVAVSGCGEKEEPAVTTPSTSVPTAPTTPTTPSTTAPATTPKPTP